LVWFSGYFAGRVLFYINYFVFEGKPLRRVEANLRNVDCQGEDAKHCVYANILLIQNEDVILNPVNPDSKQDAIEIV
jgi:hypothetical protein